MRKEYTLAQQFALISLDGLSCLHRSAAKCAAVRGIAAALFLEEILPGEETMEISASEGAGMAEDFRKKLEGKMTAIKKMKKREMDSVEKDMADLLVADGGMEIVPDLLGCDMNYYTADITMKSYRTNRDIYLSVAESVRGEILEEGPVTLECVCLLWLMRESGCLHDIFSVKEQEEIQEKMVSLSAQGSLNEGCRETARDDRMYDQGMDGFFAESDGRFLCPEEPDAAYISIIWVQEFHKTVEQMIKTCLKGKREIFKNPYLEGVNLQFSFLERRQAIFVDFVVLGTTVKERRQAMIDFLIKNGHHVEEIKNGTETLLRIDNGYYRIWPKTVRAGKIPVQGAKLQPVYR